MITKDIKILLLIFLNSSIANAQGFLACDLPLQKNNKYISGNSIDLSEVKTLKELEHKAIVAGLARTNWNLTLTAQQLGISRMTLYRKLDQHDLRQKD